MTRHYAIVEAPSVLGLRPTGVQHLPEALIDAGLAERLQARHGARIEPPAYNDQRDTETLMLNSVGIADYTVKLADAVEDVLTKGEFPIVLGGDCSIILGNLLALRRQGHYGLLFVDGHTDFYQPEANVNGEAASSNLAFATGRGPNRLTEFDGYRPLVQDEDVLVIGYRDSQEAEKHDSQPLPPDITAHDLTEVRSAGVAVIARTSVEPLLRKGNEGFWIHLDVDVLDDGIMPAVDYRIPGGLSWNELETLLRTALSTDKAVGMDVTIFNPRLDDGGNIARALVNSLVKSLGE